MSAAALGISLHELFNSLHKLFISKQPTRQWQAETVDHRSSLARLCIQVLVSFSGACSQQMTHGDATKWKILQPVHLCGGHRPSVLDRQLSRKGACHLSPQPLT